MGERQLQRSRRCPCEKDLQIAYEIFDIRILKSVAATPLFQCFICVRTAVKAMQTILCQQCVRIRKNLYDFGNGRVAPDPQDRIVFAICRWCPRGS